MRRLFLLFAFAAVLLGFVQASGAAPIVFQDPAGDSGEAPDLTSVVVDSDTAGNISFQVSIANAANLNEDSFFYFEFNSDRNRNTGSPNHLGADYAWIVQGSDYSVTFLRWTGSSWQETSSPTFKGEQIAVQTFRLQVNKSDLGNTTGLDFYIAGTKQGGDVVLARDFAPDDGVWTYTLGGSATPTPTPTPTPSRTPAKPKNAGSLPTIFGPSNRSRKDPEYSRFATRLASFFHGGTRAVFCWNPTDWASLAGSNKNTITLGYVEYRSPHQINLAPNVCKVLDRLYYHHQSPPITPAIALGVVTFAHEVTHTLGVTSEAAAQCYGMQLTEFAARLLGPGRAYGERLAGLAWRLYTPRVFPLKYLSSECRNGGKLDLYPKSNVWP
jgi:hypothetical protein